jgi:S-adenosylmethionine hydrolase
MPHPILTLTTDFGLSDPYVGTMKGVILGIAPAAVLVDVTHEVSAQDVVAGALALEAAYAYFPPGTIHLAVVDPGVGTMRKGLAASAGGYYFVAPDNGLLTHVFNREDGHTVHEITADHYFHKPVSSTFHGRDIFAPIAAWISRDVPLRQFGPQLEQPVLLKLPGVTRVRDALVQGAVLAADAFGNLITNLTPEDVPAYGTTGRGCRMVVGRREITLFRRTFGEGAPGELMVIPGSSGYLEIVKRDASAADELEAGPGSPVGIIFE